MATFMFRGLDDRATTSAEVTVVLVLKDTNPPLDLPQLLVVRRTASTLLREDPRMLAATRIESFIVSDGAPPEPLDATVHRVQLDLTPTERATPIG
jgi:hypothetical protein